MVVSDKTEENIPGMGTMASLDPPSPSAAVSWG